ncbi:hypothetical protein A2154_03685 [Candidatus Gottesmanbacteria bacterium RBG_16_43_7]|uniref:Uncharacterized protein n=1 Tax=Candidatus Gottesmanbacteria bacterium RBG_16_43_7 TaxID=1798373 RepID=A0A1F5Z9V3_9BACT|nr:MAG: hypothetical protein A2154_03685 [Candidatus Gottesmanbacteria bacterium RBG_16_43_7]
MVRDALIRCFVEAHGAVLEDFKNYGPEMTPDEFEKIKYLNPEIIAKHYREMMSLVNMLP